MKTVLALATLAAFAAVASSSVVPFHDDSDSPDVTYDSSDPSADVKLSCDFLVLPPPINSDVFDVSSSSRRNLSVGSIGAADRRLLLVTVNRAPIPGVTLVQNISYRNNNIRIRAVRAIQIRQVNQGATPVILSGGVGHAAVYVRITSARGGPLYYQVEIWGR